MLRVGRVLRCGTTSQPVARWCSTYIKYIYRVSGPQNTGNPRFLTKIQHKLTDIEAIWCPKGRYRPWLRAHRVWARGEPRRACLYNFLSNMGTLFRHNPSIFFFGYLLYPMFVLFRPHLGVTVLFSVGVVLPNVLNCCLKHGVWCLSSIETPTER